MKRKTLVMLVMILLLSLAAPTAHASDPLSPGRTGQETPSAAAPLAELPTAEIRMAAISNSSGAATLQVTEEQLMQAAETVTSGDAVQITIAADSEAGVSSISASMPKKALAAVVDQTDAEMSVVSDLGQITLSNAEIAAIVEQAEESEITVTMAREASGAKVGILSGGKEITGWSSTDGPAVLSPLAVQVAHSSRNVRLYAAGICIAAAVLILAAIVVRRCQESRKMAKTSFETEQ